MTRTGKLVVGMALVALAVSPSAWALNMTTINVSLTGEGTGKMGIAVDQSSVAAGRITFEVKNDATSETHEMLVARVPTADAELPYDAANERVVEGKLKKLGEVSSVKPGGTKLLTLDLTPGTYKLLCNMKGHYMAGMATTITVTK